MSASLRVGEAIRHLDSHVVDRAADPVLLLADLPSVEPGGVVAATALVALPIYNMAEAVHAIVRQALHFARWHPDYHLVFVDDGSSDGTGDDIEAMLHKHGESQVRLIRHSRNRGKWRAIMTGLASASADCYAYLMFTDGDLAYSLDHLPRLAQALANAEVAIGCRRGPDTLDGAVRMRRIMGWLFNRAVRACLGMRYRDSQAGLKGFRVDAAKRIFPLMTISDLCFDVEILFLAELLRFRVADVPAQVAQAHADHASSVDILRDPIRMLRSLAKIRLNHARQRYGRT